MNQTEQTVSLSMKTLIRECGLEEFPKEVIASRYADLIRRYHVENIFGYHRFGYDFSDTITCHNNGEHMIGFFHPSYEDFLENVVSSLGLKKEIIHEVSEDELTEILKQRIEHLKTVPGERQLKVEYPMLYQDLVHGRGYLYAAEEMDKSTVEGRKEYKAETHKWYSCGLQINYQRFIAAQTLMYSRFVGRRESYKQSVESLSYNKFMRTHFDMNKVAMYVMYSYLKKCEEIEDEEQITQYLSMIRKYLCSSFDKSVSLTDEDGTVINMKIIQEKLLSVRKKQEEKALLRTQWGLLPKGSRVVTREGSPRQISLKEEQVKKLNAAGNRKQAFYATIPNTRIVVGLQQYKGYYGIICEDLGIVILDTHFFEDTPSTAIGNAIYIMKASDFLELSGKNKTELQSDSRVKKINHTSRWEIRLQELLNQPVDENAREESKQLIKSLERKGTNH